jgi:hypothetical protein
MLSRRGRHAASRCDFAIDRVLATRGPQRGPQRHENVCRSGFKLVIWLCGTCLANPRALLTIGARRGFTFRRTSCAAREVFPKRTRPYAPHRKEITNMPATAILREVTRRIRALATQRARQIERQPEAPRGRSAAKALSLLAAGVVLGAVVSVEASSLVNGLYVFSGGKPARANEINHNFEVVSQAILNTGSRVDEHDARIDALEQETATLMDELAARIDELETNVPPVPVKLAQGPTFHVPKGTDVIGTATCPAGTRPIAGFTRNNHPYCSAVAEEYIEGNSWKARTRQAFCLQSFHGGIDVEVWAVCIPST